MSRKNRSPEEQARLVKIRELLQMSNISSMDDIQNLFKETIVEFIENRLESELDEELGNSNKYVSYKDLKALMADLKEVYAAVDETAALDALTRFADRWDKK